MPAFLFFCEECFGAMLVAQWDIWDFVGKHSANVLSDSRSVNVVYKASELRQVISIAMLTIQIADSSGAGVTTWREMAWPICREAYGAKPWN